MCHFILDYNYGNSTQIFRTFVSLESKNRNKCYTKQIQTMSLQPNYVSTVSDKTKNNTKTADRLLKCVRLKRLFVTFTESSYSLNFSIFSLFVRKFFCQSSDKNYLHSHGFIKNLSSNSISLILACKLKVNSRDF